MKPIPLQLVTIQMENGQHGVFIGLPLVPDQAQQQQSQVSDLWFSNVRGVPQNMSVDQLIALVQSQLCRCTGDMH